jgi:hypothetical protein
MGGLLHGHIKVSPHQPITCIRSTDAQDPELDTEPPFRFTPPFGVYAPYPPPTLFIIHAGS